MIQLMGALPGVLLMVLAVATFDLMTTWEVPLGLFYLIPICLVALYHTRQRLVWTILLSVAAWSVVDLLSRRPVSHVGIPFINALVRTVTLGGMGWFIHHARRVQTRERDLVQFVVHDLRNPLTALSLAIDGMSEGDPGFPSRHQLDQSRHALRRMHSLIDSLLELTRLERGGLPIKMEPVSVLEPIQNAARTFAPIVQPQGVSIQIQPVGADTGILGDTALLQRVLENLLANAVKVSKPNTAIHLACTRQPDGEVRFRITDEGPGIPESMAKKIFDPYVQLELQRVGLPGGTGLGLAFCRAAVQGMGGRIWVESQPGQGTTMVVALAGAPSITREPSGSGPLVVITKGSPTGGNSARLILGTVPAG